MRLPMEENVESRDRPARRPLRILPKDGANCVQDIVAMGAHVADGR